MIDKVKAVRPLAGAEEALNSLPWKFIPGTINETFITDRNSVVLFTCPVKYAQFVVQCVNFATKDMT